MIIILLVLKLYFEQLEHFGCFKRFVQFEVFIVLKVIILVILKVNLNFQKIMISLLEFDIYRQ